MKITWHVSDGYVGGDRPQETTIDDDELKEYEPGSERDTFIDACIQDDFEQKVSWAITRMDES